MAIPDNDPREVKYKRYYKDDGSIVNPADVLAPTGGGNISVTLADANDHALAATSTPCSAVWLKNADDSGAVVAVGMAANPEATFAVGAAVGWISTSNLTNIHIKGNGAKVVGFYLAPAV